MATLAGLPTSEPAKSGVLSCLVCSSCIPISEQRSIVEELSIKTDEDDQAPKSQAVCVQRGGE